MASINGTAAAEVIVEEGKYLLARLLDVLPNREQVIRFIVENPHYVAYTLAAVMAFICIAVLFLFLAQCFSGAWNTINCLFCCCGRGPCCCCLSVLRCLSMCGCGCKIRRTTKARIRLSDLIKMHKKGSGSGSDEYMELAVLDDDDGEEEA